MSKQLKIKKAIRTLRLADNDFNPDRYWVYEVKVSKTETKRFVSMKDAKAYVTVQNKLAKTYQAARRAIAAK